MRRIFLAAGEASGDLHGSLLAREILRIDPSVSLEGIGGAAMEEAGVRLLHRSDAMGVTGLWEVVRHLPRLRGLLDRLGRRLRDDPPDLLVPIDYPDFNMRLADRARRAGVSVVYYISPQVWAWRPGRVRRLARLVRRMVVIFPFEEKVYRDAGVPVTYVGHPLVDRVRSTIAPESIRERLGVPRGGHLVALLPGSRRSEIDRILPVFLETRRLMEGDEGIRWMVAPARGLPPDALPVEARAMAGHGVPTYDLLAAADLALVASGTATLEGALLGTPMLVVYKLHPVTWQLARRLVRVPHIAMANLIAGEEVVPEFLQDRARPDLLAKETRAWLSDPDRRERTRTRLLALADRLGGGDAPERAARAILAELS